jgi:hypothetical protein
VAAARHEILSNTERVTGWYDGLATTIITGGELPQPLAHDQAGDGRLVRAVRRDLLGDDGRASATAVRMIWTDDHLDVVCRLQAAITSPPRATAGQPPADRIIPPPPRRFPALLRRARTTARSEKRLSSERSVARQAGPKRTRRP